METAADHLPNHDAHDHDELSGEHGGSARVNSTPLKIALVTTATYMLAEFLGGLWTNSLALLADAGHMATDVAALALALFAIWIARRPATLQRTFGYYRTEVLAAFFNAVFLMVLSVYIFWEAWQRVNEPPEVSSLPMLVIAFGGLIVNGFAAWMLYRGGGHEHNLNTRGAYLHVLGDMLGSVGAMAAALVMLTTGWYLADPILSAGIGLLVLWGAWRLMIESLNVLMEASPKGITSDQVRATLAAVPDVEGAHDIHVWTITSGFTAMSGHLVVAGKRPWHDVLLEASDRLRDTFGINHITLQPEQVPPGLFDGCSVDATGETACINPARLGAPSHGHSH